MSDQSPEQPRPPKKRKWWRIGGFALLLFVAWCAGREDEKLENESVKTTQPAKSTQKSEEGTAANTMAKPSEALPQQSTTGGGANCLKRTSQVEIETDLLAKKSGQSNAQIYFLLDQLACSGISQSAAFDMVSTVIGHMQDMRKGSTAMRDQMMEGLRGRDRAAMEQSFDDLHRLADDNNIAGFLNRLKEKMDDIYQANLERKDPSAPGFIASKKAQAEACTPERIAASAQRAKDCAE